MKMKKFLISVCVFCIMSIFFAFPVIAKAKSAPGKLILNRKQILLYEGETKELSVEKVYPADASSKVNWYSKNKKVAVVSANGKVTAKKSGKAAIVAVSKKNPAVTSIIRVRVKKRPAQREKECSYTAKFHYDFDVSLWAELYKEAVVIRSKEDMQEAVRVIKKQRPEWKYMLKKSFLAEYRKMNFEKESLVVLFFPTAGDITFSQIASCSAKFNENGRLQCDVGVLYRKKPLYPQTVMSTFAVALRMNKRDEAMVDDFQLKFEEEK